ncbi:MAG: hypothetical protein U0797_09065 [Gemmataceae bacterium]
MLQLAGPAAGYAHVRRPGACSSTPRAGSTHLKASGAPPGRERPAHPHHRDDLAAVTASNWARAPGRRRPGFGKPVAEYWRDSIPLHARRGYLVDRRNCRRSTAR